MFGFDEVERASLVVRSPPTPVAVPIAEGTDRVDTRSCRVSQGIPPTVSEGETVMLIGETI